jgi:hypothetical protein
MNISELSLKRPIFATVMNILIVLFGAVGFSFLSVRDYPAIDPPIVTVSTSYTGANPDIIENQITEPLEKEINGILGFALLPLQVRLVVVRLRSNLTSALTLKLLPVMCVTRLLKPLVTFHRILMLLQWFQSRCQL